jgi:hypothetical protein
MKQKSTTFTTIFRVKKCYFHYDIACKKVPLSLRYAKNKIMNQLFVNMQVQMLVRLSRLMKIVEKHNNERGVN